MALKSLLIMNNDVESVRFLKIFQISFRRNYLLTVHATREFHSDDSAFVAFSFDIICPSFSAQAFNRLMLLLMQFNYLCSWREFSSVYMHLMEWNEKKFSHESFEKIKVHNQKLWFQSEYREKKCEHSLWPKSLSYMLVCNVEKIDSFFFSLFPRDDCGDQL